MSKLENKFISLFDYPHCDTVERGICYIIVQGEDGPERKLMEKFDKQHLDDYDRIFGDLPEGDDKG